MEPHKEVPGIQRNHDMLSLSNNLHSWEIVQAVNTTWKSTNLKIWAVNIHPIHAIQQIADLTTQSSR